jgi:proteasome accessory factor A
VRRRIFGTESEYAPVVFRPAAHPHNHTDSQRLKDRQKQIAARLMTGTGMLGIPKAGEFLGNGGRLYVDRGGHPEYATPECSSVADLLAHEIAGDRLVGELVRLRNSDIDPNTAGRLHLYKNNVDAYGHTYGGHENYLVTPRGLDAVDQLLPFLVTRQIYTGAGKVMILPHDGRSGYQLSQRADFFDRTSSDRTSEVRGIINIRKREITRIGQNRRLHMIIGDSNMAHCSIGLKVGTMLLMLPLVESGAMDADVELLSPAKALNAVSRNLHAKIEARHRGRYTAFTALEIQGICLDKALRFYAANPPGAEEEQWLNIWQAVLSGLQDVDICQSKMVLQRDDADLKRKVDWMLKLWLLDRSRAMGADDYQLKKLDLTYHDLDPATGLYQRCLALDLVDRLVDDKDIEAARINPPQDTRARLRGLIVQRTFGKKVEAHIKDWEHIRIRACREESGAQHSFNRFKNEFNRMEIVLEDPFQAEEANILSDLQAFMNKQDKQNDR